MRESRGHLRGRDAAAQPGALRHAGSGGRDAEAAEVAGAAEDSVEATEIVVVVEEALEVAAEAVPCVEAGAVETVIVHTKQEQEQQTKQDMPPLASVSPPSVFSLTPGIYYLSRSFFRSFPTISSPNGLVLL